MPSSKEERDRRFKKGQQSARETIAAKEIFSLRLPPPVIERIFELAIEKNIHASDLVRGWIEKGIQGEQLPPESTTGSSISVETMDMFRTIIREELHRSIFAARLGGPMTENCQSHMAVFERDEE